MAIRGTTIVNRTANTTRQRRGVRWWVAGLAALGLATGCGRTGSTTGSAEGGPGSGPRLMFITNSNADWWNAVEKGMKDGAAKFGARVELRRNEGQPEGQIRLLEDALSQPDVQGVAV